MILYNNNQEELIKTGLSETIQNENLALEDNKYNNYHFKKYSYFSFRYIKY